MRTLAALLIPATIAAPCGGAWAQSFEIGGYFGWQSAPHSGVRGDYPTGAAGTGSYDFTTGWDGKSFEAPPHYGIRATWWFADRQGVALDFNHTKVYADPDTAAANGFDRLELTDGLNVATLNYMYRFPDVSARITPYVGAGVGFTVPHVDVTTGGSRTFEYQFGGPAVAAIAGVQYEITGPWSAFAEYKGTYSRNELDLSGGGTVDTDIVTNAVNAGVTFNF